MLITLLISYLALNFELTNGIEFSLDGGFNRPIMAHEDEFLEANNLSYFASDVGENFNVGLGYYLGISQYFGLKLPVYYGLNTSHFNIANDSTTKSLLLTQQAIGFGLHLEPKIPLNEDSGIFFITGIETLYYLKSVLKEESEGSRELANFHYFTIPIGLGYEYKLKKNIIRFSFRHLLKFNRQTLAYKNESFSFYETKPSNYTIPNSGYLRLAYNLFSLSYVYVFASTSDKK